jgi:2-keto-4-pentenoate hydratase
MGIPSPLTGVLPKEGRLDYSGGVKDVGSVGDKFIVETEIGYIFGVDIANEILTDQQARDAVEFIVPVIELPNDVSPQIDGITLHENISANIGSERFMVGPSKSVSEVDPNRMPISLTVDGKVLHETNGGIAKGGQWHNLRSIVNQLVSHGYTIPKGAVVICGALGGVHKAVAGHYVADFSDLGKVEFRVRP